MLDIEKSTLAVAASVASGCRSCVDYHLGALARAGGGPAERERAITAAVRGMRAAEIGMAAHARGSSSPAPDDVDTPDRSAALLGLVVALAATDSVRVRRWLTLAVSLGAEPSDLAIVRGIAAKVRDRAAHHAEEIMDEDMRGGETCAPGRECACGCG